MGDLKVDVLLKIKKLDEETESKSTYIIDVRTYNDGAPQLVKQSYYRKGTDPTWNRGKIQGLTLEDFKLVLKKRTKIKKAMGDSDE